MKPKLPLRMDQNQRCIPPHRIKNNQLKSNPIRLIEIKIKIEVEIKIKIEIEIELEIKIDCQIQNQIR